MLRNFSFNNISIAIFISILSITLLSCNEDDPVSAQSDHFEAVGMVLYDASGKETFRIFRAETDDTLYAEAGVLSDHFEVKFLDEDETVLDAPTDEDHTLSYEIEDTEVVEFWQHEGEEGGFEFHLNGINQGATQMELFIMHEDHADYRTGQFTVIVTHGEHSDELPVGLNLYHEDDMNSPIVSVNGTDITGEISVSNGQNSEHTVIKFVTDEGEEYQPHSDEHYFEVEIHEGSENLSVTIEEDEPWVFFVTGLNAGEAEIEIKLYENHDDHGDLMWTSTHIPVEIN